VKPPLSGLRILSLEEYGVGPFASQLLADLGADVVKIENPSRGGDSSRHVPPHQVGNDSLYFESLNRRKRSVALDMKSEEGRRTFHELVETADAVLNNFRGTTATALGLRYADLRHLNRKIVCCSASGWGIDNPRAGDPAYDYLLQAYTGNMALTGEPGQPPARSATPWVDMSTGFAAALGLLTGVWSARSSGEGCDVDVSMVDVAMSQWTYMATWYLSAGTNQERQTMSRHPSVVPSQLFKSSDGYIVIMPQTESFWRGLCELLNKSELIEDERFMTMKDRQVHKEELVSILSPIFETRTSDDWVSYLGERIPVGKVNSFSEAMEMYAAEYPSQVLEWDHDVLGTVRAIDCPIRVSTGRTTLRPPPRLGEHTADVHRPLEPPSDDVLNNT